MFKKLAIASFLSLGVMTFGSAQAALVACPTNVANAVNGDIGCQYSTLQPANEGDATVTTFVNSEAYFGNNDWLLGGSLSIGTGASGTWSLAGFNTTNWDDVMLLFKSGTNPLIGYLIPDGTTSGTWSTPFLDPPFDLPGNSTQQNVSFIRVFYTPGPGGGEVPGNGGKVPEPATLGLLGLGLVGLAMIRRRKS